jgi:peptidoglycan hydrolase CwlO-like protein
MLANRRILLYRFSKMEDFPYAQNTDLATEVGETETRILALDQEIQEVQGKILEKKKEKSRCIEKLEGLERG